MDGRKGGFAAFFFVGLLTAPALADDRLPIRPGMSFAQVTELLKPTCLDYIVGGKGEKYITCIRGEGQTPEVVTATVNADDRTVYVQWRNLVGSSPPADHAGTTAKKLGFSPSRTECVIFDKPHPCWKDDGGNTLFDGGFHPESGIHTFYLQQDGLK
jgi:hypothetical protein